GVLGEEAVGRRLLQCVIDRAGLDLGPRLRTPALQLGPHLIAVRAAGEVHDTEYQQPRRRHTPTSARPARTRSAFAPARVAPTKIRVTDRARGHPPPSRPRTDRRRRVGSEPPPDPGARRFVPTSGTPTS